MAKAKSKPYSPTDHKGDPHFWQPTKPGVRLTPSDIAPKRRSGTKGKPPPNYPSLNMTEIGRQLNCHSATISRVLNGKKRPSFNLAARLAALMGWTIDQVNQLYRPKPKSRNGDSNGKSRNRI